MTMVGIKDDRLALKHGAGSTWQVARWKPLLVFCALMAASIHMLVYYASLGGLVAPHDARLYQATVLAFNYFEFGAIRRGLAGSITHLLADGMMVASAAFHVLSAVTVALPVA